MRGSGSTSTTSNGFPMSLKSWMVRAENPQRGSSLVPLQKRTMVLSSIAFLMFVRIGSSAMKALLCERFSAVGFVAVLRRGQGAQRQGMNLLGRHLLPEQVVDHAVLLDARLPLEPLGDDARAVMVVGPLHLGLRAGEGLLDAAGDRDRFHQGSPTVPVTLPFRLQAVSPAPSPSVSRSN